MDNKNLKINEHFFLQGNIELSKEQKEVLNIIEKLYPNLMIDKNKIQLTLNYYHNLSDENGKIFEINGLLIIILNKKTYIFCFEHKNYSSVLDIKKAKIDDFQKLEKKMHEFREYFFNESDFKQNKCNLFLIFSIDSEIVEIVKINSKIDKKRKKESIFKILNNKNSVWVEHEFLEDKLKCPRDILFFKDSLEQKHSSLNKSEESYIVQKINSNDKYIFITTGFAGSGKTALALNLYSKLFEKYDKSFFVFQIINQALCNEVVEVCSNNKLKSTFLSFSSDLKEKINSYLSKKHINEKIFVFIDEAQRLRCEDLEFLKSTFNNLENIFYFFFGDDMQSIRNVDEGIKEIKKLFDNKFIYLYNLDKDYRLPKNVVKKLQFIFCLTEQKNRKTSSKYDVQIIDSFDEFINKFKFDNSKRIITSIENCEISCKLNERIRDLDISYATKQLPNRKKFLYIPEIRNKYILYPYDVISREIENMYVYIPETITLNEKNQLINKSNIYIRFLEQLNVLLTRATKKLFVFIENEKYKSEVIKRMEI